MKYAHADCVVVSQVGLKCLKHFEPTSQVSMDTLNLDPKCLKHLGHKSKVSIEHFRPRSKVSRIWT